MNRRISLAVAWLLLSVGCAPTTYNPLDEFDEYTPSAELDAPEPDPARVSDAQLAEHGRYLVGLLGCGSCHTDGAIVGRPNRARTLAGSSIGIAYSNPLETKKPGVVYPPNLTSDMATGIGSWSEAEIASFLGSGVGPHGARRKSVMPWPAYSRLKGEDAMAIAAYLHSLPPVNHQVPKKVPRGKAASNPFVYFSVYMGKK